MKPEQENIEDLASKITQYQASYYNGTPEVDDATFDRAWDKLKRLAPNHPIFAKVGKDAQPSRKKHSHIIFMNSQNKVNSSDTFLKWAHKINHPSWIVQYKLDGVSVELQYDRGTLTHAVTRGDGKIGDDITNNVRCIPNIPQSIDRTFTGGIRGEVLMTKSTHARHYPQFANCRNTTAGIVKRLDGVGSQHLQIICYDALHASNGNFFTNFDALLGWLAQQKFQVVTWKRCAAPPQVIEWHNEVAQIRPTLDIDIDGLIVRGIDIDASDSLKVRPEKQVAFKFTAEEQHTTLLQVEWSQSGHLYTPIAITSPVQLAGTTVQRANLVNIRLIREMDLRIGSIIAITKRGEIIPKIEYLVDNSGATQTIEPPSECRECHTPLVIEDTRIYCPNRQCPQLLIRRIRRWIEVLDIKEFGEVLIEQLFRNNHIQSVADLYTLRPNTIAALERQGNKSAENALANLKNVTRLPLARFVAACDIENVGELTMNKLVAAGYHSIDALYNASAEELTSIEGIAHIFAETIVAGIRERYHDMQKTIAASGIRIEVTQDVPLKGMSFCFTGPLRTLKRKEAEKKVHALGGVTTSSVTKTLTYLVTNDTSTNSGKLMQAKRYGTTIIDEETFLSFIDAE